MKGLVHETVKSTICNYAPNVGEGGADHNKVNIIILTESGSLDLVVIPLNRFVLIFMIISKLTLNMPNMQQLLATCFEKDVKKSIRIII